MKFIDLQAQYHVLQREIDSAIQQVLTHGQFIMGPEISVLENEIEDFLGVRNVISCANGTDALQMLFMAFNIGAGDAVFAPDITFIATTESAALLGATPVFCDVDPYTFNLSPLSLERQIKSVLAEDKLCPKAVVAVDFLGNPVDYEAINIICDRYGLILIEDAAQSFGASYRGKRCGSFGKAATTSFFPAKPLGCYGDGGAIMTDDDALAETLRSIRLHGKGEEKYNHICIGVNSRLDTIQAAILLPKLKALKEYEIDLRNNVAERYNTAFGDAFQLVEIEKGNVSVYAQYVILADNITLRNKLASHLKAHDIPLMIYYPVPQHKTHVFSDLNAYSETYKVSNDYCERTISLPMSPYLSGSDQAKIISTVLEIC